MDVKTIMTSDETGSGMVDYARGIADKLVRNNLKTNQIRNIFTEVRQIESIYSMDKKTEALRRLTMLKPKLAYQSKRHREVSDLEKELVGAIDEVVKAPEGKRDEIFQRFVDFFEAILAYHKALGGRD